MTGEGLCRRSEHQTEVSSTSSAWDIPDVALDTPLRLSGLTGTAQIHDGEDSGPCSAKIGLYTLVGKAM